MKKVVTSVSSNNHEPSGEAFLLFSLSSASCGKQKEARKKPFTKAAHKMDMKNTRHYDGNFPDSGKHPKKKTPNWNRTEIRNILMTPDFSPSIMFHHF